MADTIESNPLFPLLTDALRAGPGSPEWHQAIARLRSEGLSDSDEYRMLVSVREHLASGRDYKSIRAGPGFTRKVLENIEQERKTGGKRPSGVPVATIVASISVLAVVVVMVYVGYRLWSNPPPKATAEELAGAYFPKVQQSAAFDSGVPAGWREVGSSRLPLKADKNGLRPGSPEAAAPSTNPADTIGRAVVSTTPVSADEPFAVEVKLKPGRVSEGLIVEIFISSDSDFSADKSTSSKELVWLLKGTHQQVRLGGGDSGGPLFDGQRPDVPAGAGAARSTDPWTIRINVNREFAVAFNGGQQLWAGPHGLAAKPRTAGVRFLCVDPTRLVSEPPVVQSIRVLTK